MYLSPSFSCSSYLPGHQTAFVNVFEEPLGDARLFSYCQQPSIPLYVLVTNVVTKVECNTVSKVFMPRIEFI